MQFFSPLKTSCAVAQTLDSCTSCIQAVVNRKQEGTVQSRCTGQVHGAMARIFFDSVLQTLVHAFLRFLCSIHMYSLPFLTFSLFLIFHFWEEFQGLHRSQKKSSPMVCNNLSSTVHIYGGFIYSMCMKYLVLLPYTRQAYRSTRE